LHAAGRIIITPSKYTHSSNVIPHDYSPLLKYGVLPYSEYDVYGPGTGTILLNLHSASSFDYQD
jgi:hypothetical protein